MYNLSPLSLDFLQQEALVIAPCLIGKLLVRQWDDKTISTFRITEIEVYVGAEDAACHAHKGKTKRTEVMFEKGGLWYVYLIYGMYWLLNIVVAEKNKPEAILIRGVSTISGPGRVGKALQIDKSFNGKKAVPEQKLWLAQDNTSLLFKTTPRIGINYAPEPWRSKLWRYIDIAI